MFVSAPVSALVPMLMAVVGIGADDGGRDRVPVRGVRDHARHRGGRPAGRAARWSRWPPASAPGAASSTGKILLPAALPEILAGLRLGAIRGVKGVVIGQLLIAILGVGELFEIYSQNFLFEEFWALVIVVFAFAYAVSEAIARLERRVEHYARTR